MIDDGPALNYNHGDEWNTEGALAVDFNQDEEEREAQISFLF